jgi:hypothetical protein
MVKGVSEPSLPVDAKELATWQTATPAL